MMDFNPSRESLKLLVAEVEADINTLSSLKKIVRSNYANSGLREFIDELVAYRNDLAGRVNGTEAVESQVNPVNRAHVLIMEAER